MIRIAHSPDTDDYFFFWALATGLIDADGFSFSYDQYDTQTLNLLGTKGEYDVLAVSVGAYRNFADKYLILPHGASIGRNYGPVVVSNRNVATKDLDQLRIAIPGRTTTAARILRMLAPECRTVEISIEPFGLMFDALRQGQVEALLLIHEGQISYHAYDLRLIVDLGAWWHEKYQLPLPLGVNVIKRSLDSETSLRLSRVIARSIRYALDHRDEAIDYLVQVGRKRGLEFHSPERLHTYLAMYANEDSYILNDDCKKAIELILSPELAEDGQVQGEGRSNSTPIEYAAM